MSTVNAVTIVAENITAANLVAGNSSANITIVANSVYIKVGTGVTVNSRAVKISNSTSQTVINTSAVSAQTIILNGVTYSTITSKDDLIDYQVFTSPIADNKWYKPSWVKDTDIVTIMLWGGGGGGGSSVNGPAGGGGGACVFVNKLAGECNSVCNVVVAAGGTVGTNGTTMGQNGGNSIFWSNTTFSITAYGGGGGGEDGGAGGGWFGVGSNSTHSFNNGPSPVGGGPLGGNGTSVFSTFGGGSGSNSTVLAGGSVYGGGGGHDTSPGGNSVYGGAGGGRTTAIATSVFGGNGGNNSTSPTVPGGGGGAKTNAGAGGSNGANGLVRIWVTSVTT
jgi:hypothetical protein